MNRAAVGPLVVSWFLVGCQGPGPGDDGDTTGAVECTPDVGVVCEYAGTGQAGYNGSGKDKAESWLYFPMDITFSPAGKPVISDWNNHKLRMVEDDGTLVTIMGTDFIGDGDPDRLDATVIGADGLTVNLNHPTQTRWFDNGILLSASWHTHKLRTWDPATGLTRVYLGMTPDFVGDNMEDAIDARMNQPVAVEIDSNQDVYIVDMRNERVRFLDGDGSGIATQGPWQITTIAGDGNKGYTGDGGPAREAALSFPRSENPEPGGSIAFSPDESKLYIADTENHIIRVLDMETRVLDLYAGTPETPGDVDGPGLQAQFNFPRDLQMTPEGILFVADSDNNKIRAIDTATGEVSTYVGTGNPTCAGDGPQYIPRTCPEQATGGDGSDRLDVDLYRPFGVALDLDGNLVIADAFNHRIRTVYR